MKYLISIIYVFFSCLAFSQNNYQVIKNKLVLPEPVVFLDHANDVLDTTDAMIAYVAQYMIDNPSVTKLRVESHVFTEKDANENMKLSLQRAAIISYYLTLKGIDCSRLTASGFGSTKPLDLTLSNEDNTRLEFHIQDLKNKSIPYINAFDCKFYNPCDD